MSKGWGRPFEEPIKIDGRKLMTLRDAGEYIAALPKKEHASPEWQAAIEALMLVAEKGGPTMFARIGIMRALNCRKPAADSQATAQACQDLQDRAMKRRPASANRAGPHK